MFISIYLQLNEKMFIDNGLKSCIFIDAEDLLTRKDVSFCIYLFEVQIMNRRECIRGKKECPIIKAFTKL